MNSSTPYGSCHGLLSAVIVLSSLMYLAVDDTLAQCRMSWWLLCCVNTSKYEANKAFNPGAGQSGEWCLVSHDWRPN